MATSGELRQNCGIAEIEVLSPAPTPTPTLTPTPIPQAPYAQGTCYLSLLEIYNGRFLGGLKNISTSANTSTRTNASTQTNASTLVERSYSRYSLAVNISDADGNLIGSVPETPAGTGGKDTPPLSVPSKLEGFLIVTPESHGDYIQ